jgi:DUF1365 family protein
MSAASARLLVGEVMHRRLFPVRYRFTYRVFSLLLDVDRIEESLRPHRLISHNRFNLFSFHERDHGPRDGSSLRRWLEHHLDRMGLELDIERVELLCFPRVLGYVFNPLSVWYCYAPSGCLVAVLCEVRNTFGEAHGYLLHDHNRPLSWPVLDQRPKIFHVSPFIDMDATYHFRFGRDEDSRSIVIREYQEGELMLVAVQKGKVRPLGDGSLLRLALTVPLLTFKVMASIHWQALKIWLRGARFFSKPSPPREEMS